MAQIVLRGVSKDFNGTPVLKEIDLQIDPHEFCVFVGPSGCGKSTLLRLLAGLEEPSAGEIEIDGVVVNDVAPAARNVAMVFQSYALYPHMSVHENMAFGLRHQKVTNQEIERRVSDAARILHLDGLLERKPRELSGGQRQRVAIGRAIVRQPKVFLFDEPLSNLDAALRAATRVELARLHRDLGSASTVYVTHDQTEAMTLADKIVLLRPLAGAAKPFAPNQRAGNAGGAAVARSIAQVGTPLDLYHRPANQFVAGFIGSPPMNFLEGRVAHCGPLRIEVDLPGLRCAAAVEAQGLALGEPIIVGIRPEHVRVDGDGSTLRAAVTHVERLGEFSTVYVRLPEGQALLAKTPRGDIAVGDHVPLGLPAAAIHVFRADGNAVPRTA